MRCSEAARARADTLPGSAPVAQRWLLVELPSAWEAQPLDSAPITPEVRDVLHRAEQTHRATVVLVRRTGRRPRSAVHGWWAVDAVRGVEVGGQWAAPEDLLDAAAALGGPLAESSTPSPRRLLVCTHANRDQCCAIRGRPVVAALTVRWPAEAWECTHLGGHRFAATFAVLPEGAVYGNVDGPQEAVRIVADHWAGRVDAAHLRGLSPLAPPAQAAVAAALADFGPAPFWAVRVEGVETDGDDSVVRLHGRAPVPESLVATVRHTAGGPEQLSCRPGKAKATHTYAVTALTADP